MRQVWSRLFRRRPAHRPPHRTERLGVRGLAKIGMALGTAATIAPLGACAGPVAASSGKKVSRLSIASSKAPKDRQRIGITDRLPVPELKNYRISHWSRSGMASWYGAAFANRLTSSGDRFDPEKLTAAHRRLPLGTKVLVVDARSKRSVIVTINDRGPFNSRVIDLSRGAARHLGMLNRGLAHVHIAVLTPTGQRDENEVVEVAQAPE